MSADPGAQWRRERTEAAEHQHRELLRRREQESAAARSLIGQFVAEATRRSIAPVALRARSFSGSTTFRTRLTGWYLRTNKSVAVGSDGEFYVLSVPGGFAAWLRGANPTPADPPLVLGAGGRDGESIDIADALRTVLERGNRL